MSDAGESELGIGWPDSNWRVKRRWMITIHMTSPGDLWRHQRSPKEANLGTANGTGQNGGSMINIARWNWHSPLNWSVLKDSISGTFWVDFRSPWTCRMVFDTSLVILVPVIPAETDIWNWISGRTKDGTREDGEWPKIWARMTDEMRKTETRWGKDEMKENERCDEGEWRMKRGRMTGEMRKNDRWDEGGWQMNENEWWIEREEPTLRFCPSKGSEPLTRV